MIIRAKLKTDIGLKATISDSSPIAMLNVDLILQQAQERIKPFIHKALVAAFTQLTAMGVQIEIVKTEMTIVQEK